MRLTLVGTGHVFHIGEIVSRIIENRRPHVVCVELDPMRLSGLQERARLTAFEEAGDPRADQMRRQQEEATKRLPILYRFLARLQEKLAKQEGVEAGSEMLAAVQAAGRLGVPVATIDVDAQALIRRAWREMKWKERLRFLWAVFRGRKGNEVESELAEYQDDPVAYLARVGEEFPTLKRVLIDERDAHMAGHILRLRDEGVEGVRRLADKAHSQKEAHPGEAPPVAQEPEGGADAAAASVDASRRDGQTQEEDDPEEDLVVVAVVGDGHVPGMLPILEKVLGEGSIEAIRVGDLRSGRLPEAQQAGVEAGQSGDAGSVSVHYEVGGIEAPQEDPPA